MNQLSDADYDKFTKLHHTSTSTDPRFIAISQFQTNAIISEDKTDMCLYTNTAFINHSCDPNAYWYPAGNGNELIS